MANRIEAISKHVKESLSDRRARLLVSLPSLSSDKGRRRINYIFRLRDRLFFRKKKPSSEEYPFRIVDPYEVFGEDFRFSEWTLVGDNWRAKEDAKPVAIFWGFNNWKWGFVSDYLADYRVVFAPRKILSVPSLIALRKFPIKPSAFFFWGFTEPRMVRWYASARSIPTFRMEDGFIRSAALGASHATPYSLIVDSKGLYYDPKRESDIEAILNGHDFSDAELEAAEESLDLIRALDIAKYNPPSFNGDQGDGIKIRKKVAVIGQVDNDMSIRLGNVDKWTMTELIRLAKFENPDAQIVYRPHPEVYKGYQKSKFRARAVTSICEIANPDVPLGQFLGTVDHVYTITSLSGLEALLRGKKVTVVGAAFYAGWGLTDDRVKLPRRTRQRSLMELFAAIYLRYPKYLADLDDSAIGIQAACLKIKADYEIGRFQLIKAGDPEQTAAMRAISASAHWPQLVFGAHKDPAGRDLQKIIGGVDFGELFLNRPGPIFQATLLYSICGMCPGNAARNAFLSSVRGYVDAEVFNELLLDLSHAHPGEYVAKQLAWLLAEVKNPRASVQVLSDELIRSIEANLRMIEAEAAEESPAPVKAPAAPIALTAEQADLLYEVFDYSISVRDIDRAIKSAKRLLLAGYYVPKLIPKMAQIASLKFDNESAKVIAMLSHYCDLNGMMALLQARSYSSKDISRDLLAFITLLAKLISLKPDRVNDAIFLIKRFPELFDEDKLERILIGILMLNNRRSMDRVLGLLAIERPHLALSAIEGLLDSGETSGNIRIVYSQALSYAGRLDDALAVMDRARQQQKVSSTYRETLRLYVLAGMYEEGYKLVLDAKRRRIDLGDMHPRKIYFGSRMVKEAFFTFTELSLKRTVETYYPEKYFHYGSPCGTHDSLFMLAIFGPGDEIRFASTYNLLPQKLQQKDVSISCDPRLQALFSRSFRHLRFVPVPRPRNSDPIEVEEYSKVLGSDLIGVINNTATESIDAADGIMLVTDMLHECLPSYKAFPGTAYLKPDARRAAEYRDRLPSGKRLVGLSWRSSLTTHSRNEHYLTIEELEPIFSIDGIQFVNFQYDECQDELDWVESRYPGKLINFSDLDQYNDLDGVAALMTCMDLMLAPATTVVELAGALGCPTWMFSNSSELHWRRIDGLGTDVWHNSIRHIEGSVLGDKSTLVAEVHKRLSAFATARSVEDASSTTLEAVVTPRLAAGQ